jgi:two-component system sensor histidine kinase KdpD
VSLTAQPPSPSDPILVALGSEARTLRLVHAGFHMAREQGRPWVAVHVEVPDWETPAEADQARSWLREAQDLGAETAWVLAATVGDGIIEEGVRRGAAQVVMGKSRPRGVLARLERSHAQETIRRGLGVRIVNLPLESPAAGEPETLTWQDSLVMLLATAAVLGVSFVFGEAMFAVFGFPGVPPVYALGIGFLAHRWGKLCSLPASVAAVLTYDRIFLHHWLPVGQEEWSFSLNLAATLVLVQIVVILVERLRQETRSLRRREAENLLLMVLGRALARCATAQEVATVLAERIQDLFQAQSWVLVPGPGDAWRSLPEEPGAPACPGPSVLLPRLAEAAQRADPFEPLFLDESSFVALAGQGGAEGLLLLRRAAGGRFPQGVWGLVQSVAVQGAMALDRVRWLEAAQQARLDTESERLRNTLLGAVSHDLRTPLAAIQGAATSLMLPEPLPENTRMDLLSMIREESERLARLLGDLLELTRLQSGAIRVQKEWQLLDEVVGSAVGRLEARQGPLPIRVELPADLPLVPLDGALMEQVLINLLSNALRHAPESPVDLRAWQEPEAVQLEITDRGPGIPTEFHRRVFDKFFRMPGSRKDGGVGLGLAICGAIVKIHGGAIWVQDRPGGGACFRISLPLEGLPPGDLDPGPPATADALSDPPPETGPRALILE